MRARLARALLLLVLLAGTTPGFSQGADAELRQAIEAAASRGEFQAAMGLTHRIRDDPQRFAVEADLLFRARSYRAALGRASEAWEGGIQTPLLLARGIGSALWLGDARAARSFVGAFESAIARLPKEEQGRWQSYAADLIGQIEALEEQAADIQARVRLAKACSLGALALALGSMLWLLLRASE